MFYVPRVVVDLPFIIGELVCARSENFGDDKGSFPGRRELVMALVALLEPQHQVTNSEGLASDSSSVVASESLLVLGRM